MPPPKLVSMEYIVSDLDIALELFVTHMGLEIVQRGRHALLDAEVVMLDAGNVVISLLQPTDLGEGEPLAMSEPRLSQVVFTVADGDAFLAMRDRLIEAGASVSQDGPGVMHLGESMITGMFGKAPSPVIMVEPPVE